MTMAMLTTAAHKWENELDTKLWKNLRYHIDVARVYKKLPVKEFFQCCVVCKEWNRLAGDIEFLESTFRDQCVCKPFFFLEPNFLVGDDVYLLASVDKFGKWSTMQLPWYFSNCQALEGAVCYTVPQTKQLKVFNIHSRIWNTLNRYNPSKKLVFGMYVDTSMWPYVWKIILGGIGFECTQIYNSSTNKWSIKGSGLHASFNRAHQKGMACSKNILYIQYCNIILTYDLEKDVWSVLNVPILTPRGSFILAGIGAWQGHVFVLANECVRELTLSICVWEYEVTNQGWVVYSWMPFELYVWVTNYADVRLHVSYCTGYFVVYVWVCHETGPGVEVGKFVQFNLASKEWTKAQLPYDAIENSGKRKLALLA